MDECESEKENEYGNESGFERDWVNGSRNEIELVLLVGSASDDELDCVRKNVMESAIVGSKNDLLKLVMQMAQSVPYKLALASWERGHTF